MCTSNAVGVLHWFSIDAGAGSLVVTVVVHEILQQAGNLLKSPN